MDEKIKINMTVTHGDLFEKAINEINQKVIISDVKNIRRHFILCKKLRTIMNHSTYQVIASRPELLVWLGISFKKKLYLAKGVSSNIEDIV